MSEKQLSDLRWKYKQGQGIRQPNSTVGAVHAAELGLVGMLADLIKRVTEYCVNEVLWYRLNNALQRVWAYQTPNSFGGEDERKRKKTLVTEY